MEKTKTKMRKTKELHKKIIKEINEATPYEVWEGVRDNFTFGFIGATLVVFIATKTDIAVLLGYLAYYFFMGKIVNRPKYVTDLGKLIVFPIPSALGAFSGYKLSLILIEWIKTL
jgi:hypothetical protein